MHLHKEGHTYTARQTDRQTDRQTNRYRDRQTERKRERERERERERQPDTYISTMHIPTQQTPMHINLPTHAIQHTPYHIHTTHTIHAIHTIHLRTPYRCTHQAYAHTTYTHIHA